MSITLVLEMKIWIYWSESISRIYFYIFLNKNWIIYWSEPSFTGLGPEDWCSSWGLLLVPLSGVSLVRVVALFDQGHWLLRTNICRWSQHTINQSINLSAPQNSVITPTWVMRRLSKFQYWHFSTYSVIRVQVLYWFIENYWQTILEACFFLFFFFIFFLFDFMLHVITGLTLVR